MIGAYLMARSMKKPELLAPAGNLEKLKIAYAFGADAAYIAGPQFGLREGADNFNYYDLQLAKEHALQCNKKLYITLNSMSHNNEIENLKQYLSFLNHLEPDALIISDAGVFNLAKKNTDLELHISTQASVVNQWSCEYWKRAGASRIVLGREVSLSECLDIKNFSNVELEIFIHGSMCISYAGKCTISSYTAGRDSNRGGCIQSCRHTYNLWQKSSNSPKNSPDNLSEEKFLFSGNIMDARDLISIDLVPSFILLGIESLKIEGRMKSNLYVANTVSVYRDIIDECFELLKTFKLSSTTQSQSPSSSSLSSSTLSPIEKSPTTFVKTKDLGINHDKIQAWQQQLELVSNRGFTSGNLEQKAGEESVRYQESGYIKQVEFIGTIKGIPAKQTFKQLSKFLFLDVKAAFNKGDTLIAMSPSNSPINFVVNELVDCEMNSTNLAKPNTIVGLPNHDFLKPYTVIYKYA